jgi:hypothetical protein
MFPFATIAWQLVRALPYFLLDVFFWLILIFVNYQYKRMAQTEVQLFGIKRISPRKLTFISAGLGLLAGILGSFILIFVGVSVSNTGFGYVWLLAILFALINVRFVCFAYAGGLVALSSLIFGFPKVGVPELMALVAILHLIEALLILASGYLHPVPIYLKNKASKVVGGFSLQKFWPIPLIVLGATAMVKPEDLTSMISMPDWWPLIKPGIELLPNQEIMYQMFPIVAALGYGDLAVSSQPKEKSRKTALYLALFSLVLLGLAIAASRFYPLSFLAAVFAPLGHELVASHGLKTELEGVPLYSAGERGVRVLDVIASSPAAEFGFKSGDLILSANNREVNTRSELEDCFYSANGYLWFDGEDYQGNKIQYEGWYRQVDPKMFGLLFVPEGNEEFVLELRTTPPWKAFWRKFGSRIFHGRMKDRDRRDR